MKTIVESIKSVDESTVPVKVDTTKADKLNSLRPPGKIFSKTDVIGQEVEEGDVCFCNGEFYTIEETYRRGIVVVDKNGRETYLNGANILILKDPDSFIK